MPLVDAVRNALHNPQIFATLLTRFFDREAAREPDTTRGSVEYTQEDGLLLRSWYHGRHLEFSSEEDAEVNGYYHLPKLREAYTSQCTTTPGKGVCKRRTCIQCQLEVGEEWNPMVAFNAADVKGMLQHAGALKQNC